jgi:hypothetical protein
MIAVLLMTLLTLGPQVKTVAAEAPKDLAPEAAKRSATDSIRVLFIYGSYPANGYKKTEHKWFGGIHGGHVALEIAPDSVLSFRNAKHPCHVFPQKRHNSIWEIKSVHGMWESFPPHNYNENDLNRAVITIPVTTEQKRKIDSMASAYLRKTPYDYAVAGMRCASASYDIMARAGLFKEYGSSTWWKIIMPRDLRAILLKKARSPEGKDWRVTLYSGSKRRVWERDRE